MRQYAKIAFYALVGVKAATGLAIAANASKSDLDKATLYWNAECERGNKPSYRTACSVAGGHAAFTTALMMNIPAIYAEQKAGAKLDPELHDLIGYGSESVGPWSCRVTSEEFRMTRK